MESPDGETVELRIAVHRSELERLALQLRAESVSELVPDGPIGAVAYARHLLNLRRARDAWLPGVELGEPSWDIVLDLFVQDACGRRVSISSACIGAGAPATTALRHLARLVEQGVVLRESDSEDARRAFVRLAPTVKQGLTRTLAAALGELGLS